VTVFHDRRSAAYNELSGEPVEYITGISGQNNASTFGYSGGQLPPLSATQPKYPLDQTASVVDMR
jgi:hypothetical protein